MGHFETSYCNDFITDGKMFGFGFVQFATVDEAKTAITEMNAKLFLGKLLCCLYSSSSV